MSSYRLKCWQTCANHQWVHTWFVEWRQLSYGLLSLFVVGVVVYGLYAIEGAHVRKVRLIGVKVWPRFHTWTQTESFKTRNMSHLSEVEISPSVAKSVNRMIQPPMSQVFNCQKLLKGDVAETSRASSFRVSSPYKPPSHSDIMQSTTNCAVFRKARGYQLHATPLEESFPLAFSILVHKSVEQFERLLRAIFRPNNYYCVHVDKKATPFIHNAVKAIVNCFENVFVASKLEVVVYAGYTRLQADINCMKDLIRCCKDWKYVLNMAGTEFPLRPNHHIVHILKLFNGTNMVERHMRTISPWQYERKFMTWTNDVNKGRIFKTSDANDPAPFKLKVTKCSAYAALSRNFIDFVLHNSTAQAFLNWSKTTYSPDELFWGTLNNLHGNPQLTTPGGEFSNEDNHLTRAVMWKSNKCHGKNVHIICNFGAGDLPWLKGGYQLIANKFDLKVDQVAYSCMEELLAARQKEKYPSKIETFKTYIQKARRIRKK